MTLLNPSASNMQRAIQEALGAHWRLFLFQGVVMIVLGVIAIIAPVAATLAVNIFIGWLLVISGVVGLVALFSAKDIPAFLWNLVTAALSLAVGGLLVWKPIAGALTLTIVLTAFFIAEGVFQIITSIAYRDIMAGSWVWMLVSGISDLVLALIIIVGWPFTAVWALGLLVGVNLITSGWAVVMAAFAGRSVSKSLGGHAAAASR